MSSLGWALIQYDCILIKREILDIESHTQGESYVQMTAKKWIMHLLAEECQSLLAVTRHKEGT
jgi:hypothetical protein